MQNRRKRLVLTMKKAVLAQICSRCPAEVPFGPESGLLPVRPHDDEGLPYAVGKVKPLANQTDLVVAGNCSIKDGAGMNGVYCGLGASSAGRNMPDDRIARKRPRCVTDR